LIKVKRGESVLRFMITPGKLGVELNNRAKTTSAVEQLDKR